MKRSKVAALAALTVALAAAETPFDSSVTPSPVPLEIPANRGAAALWQSLKKLHTRASLMMITAHPDDEDGPVLTYESRGLGVRVSLLTLNRGEGGANVMSSDFWDALGLVRTEELLAAGQHYGVEQYWTRFCDYGFSKTMEESFSKWNHEAVLGDVVRVIRTVRPLVITSVFVGGPSDGHGNHQVAGQMAKEAFDAAGDANRFPDQIREGLRPWKPLKYYARLAWGGPSASKTVSIPTGGYDALLGETYRQLAREGLGFQKTQNGGTWIPSAGPSTSDYHRYASLTPAGDTEADFFDGIDTSIAALGPNSGFVAAGLKQISAAVDRARSKFSANSPEDCAPALAEGLRATHRLLNELDKSEVPAEVKYDLSHELNVKAAQFNNALVEALGVSLRATVMPERLVNPLYAEFMGDADTFQMAVPGQRFGVQVNVLSEGSKPGVVSRIYLEGLTSSEKRAGQFEVTVPDTAGYTRPYFSRASIEQAGYDISDGKLIGSPLAPYPLTAWAEVTFQGANIRVGQVVQTTHRETGPGVVYQPLTVGPAISVQVSPQSGIVPLKAEGVDLTVHLHSNMKGPAQGSVVLRLPEKWKSEPAEQPFATTNDGEDLSLRFRVRPVALSEQRYEIAAVAKLDGKEYRDGYRQVGYAGLRPYFLYQSAAPKLTGVDVAVAPGLKIGYIQGSGDDVPSALQELGINVSFLNTSDLGSADLTKFDAILLGVRAYAARPDLIQNNQRLLDYVKSGGVAIAQYNTPEFDHNFGPYPYKMGDEPEEVTDEESEMKLLNQDSPLFTWPNRITVDDFKGWIEERGSKFMTSWDARYEPLLETHDSGQAPQRGGLLYAKYGKGIYIYNAYAFYRELPEGVPGAFRLMANMLSLPKNPNR